MERFLKNIEAKLEVFKEQGIFRKPFVQDESTKEYINFSTNDYLDLAKSDFTKNALINAIENNQIGSGASRLLTGNFDSILAAEKHYAKFFGYEDCIFFPSGFQANIGLVSSLFSSEDCVFFDKHVHSSVVFGLEQSKAQIKSFKHNDFEHLERRILNTKTDGRLILITESCFSMDGDSPDFDKLKFLKEKYNLLVIVDEAHAYGVLGENGRGLAGAGLADIAVGTFGKAFGHYGAFLLLPSLVKSYLINTSRPLIYTTALPPYFGDFAITLLDKIKTMDEDRRNILENAAFTKALLEKNGFNVEGNAHILAIQIGEEKVSTELAKKLFQKGIIASSVRSPTVPLGKAIIRIALNNKITRSEIENFVKELIFIKNQIVVN